VVGRTCDKGVGSRDRASRNGNFAAVGILQVRAVDDENGGGLQGIICWIYIYHYFLKGITAFLHISLFLSGLRETYLE
jgi:hypothetical protein